jgi:hypothetical protein
LFRLFASSLIATLLTTPTSAELATPKSMVAIFDAAMNVGPELEELQQLAVANGFTVLSQEKAGDQLSFLETVDPSGDLYLVGIRDVYESSGAIMSTLIVTSYETDNQFAKELLKTAKATLPPGPTQSVELKGGFVFGEAWEASYPDLITLQVKYHQEERASLIEASRLRIK